MKNEMSQETGNNLNRIPLMWEVVLNIIFIIYAVVCIIPLMLTVSISLTDERTLLTSGYNLIPLKFSTASYEYVMNNLSSIIHAYGITLFNTIVGTTISVMIIAFYAYPLSRKDFKYRSFFTLIMFITMIFNGGLVPWYLVCTKILNLQNSIWAMILPVAFNAWYVIILRTFFTTTIPDSLIESAKIDGAGEFRIFFRIILPLSLPGLATIALFATLGYWNDWWLPLMLTSKPMLANLQFLLYKMLANIEALTQGMTMSSNLSASTEKLPSESIRMALCIIAIGPVIFAYPFFQRYFIKGLTVGAIKG